MAFTDLSNCDREPIHTPGSIQPHGFLLVLEPETGQVVGVSSNTREVFWREGTALLGSDVRELLGPELGERVLQARENPDFHQRALLVGETTVPPGRTGGDSRCSPTARAAT